jgi:site-specific DNA-methyltransferase (adenine-specific)
MIKPYYQDDYCTIYHGDCLNILPELPKIDLICADPPYCIGYKPRGHQSTGKLKCKRNFGPKDKLHGDSGKLDFDPRPIMQHFKNVDCIWWGANNYADKLPISRGWLVWYKAHGMEKTDFGHAEMAWTSKDMPIRGINYLWMGMLKKNKEKSRHPTMKPLQVIKWSLSFFDFSFVLDPFMGSGTTLRASKDLQRKAIGIEIEERYCEIAAKRLEQEVLNLG